MENKDIIANNIAYYRKKAGLSQLELANKLQYSNKNISKWENGETTPNVFTLKNIADIFNITVDDLLKEPTMIDDTILEEHLKARTRRKKVFDIAMLGLANAILISFAFIAIAILGLCQVTAFNKWLLILYITPLSALSIFIFIRCKLKRIDPFTLSIMGWLIAISVYVSLINVTNISFVFIVAAAYQVLIVFITLAVNLKLIDKFTSKFKILKTKITRKK